METLIIIVAVILFLGALAGNIDLIILISGGSLPDKQGFLIFLAIVLDIALVGLIISRIAKKVTKAAEEKETRRINEVESKIAVIKSTFTPKELPFDIQQTKVHLKFDSGYLNTEINRSVKEYKDGMRKTVSECMTIDKKINKILSYNSTPDGKLEYLSEKINELEKLKQQSDSFHSRIDKKRIKLLNEDKKAIEYIRHAFFRLKESEKCNSNGTPIKELVSDHKPFELNMFIYKYAPLILTFQNIDYCFFGNVILVFDYAGVYITALDPSILQLTVSKQTEHIYKSTNYTQNSNNTGNDSHTVRVGESRTTWTYTRKDGFADLRYTYNPMITYHTDEVMYGQISFYLSEKISYTFSSYQAILAMETAAKNYVKKFNNMRDTLPDFFDLIKILDSNSSVIDDILRKYKSSSKNYFCQLT